MTDRAETAPTPDDPRVKFFDHIAAGWDEKEQSPGETIRRVEEHLDLLGLCEGMDVLEVGCGTGQLTAWLVEKVAPGRVLAIDFSRAMLELAGGKQSGAELRHADVCSADLGAEAFDLALCFHSFPHFRDQRQAVANLARALRPGGRLVVMHLNSSAGVNAFHDSVGKEVHGDHLPDPAGWDELLDEAHLRKTQQIDREGLFFLEAKKS